MEKRDSREILFKNKTRAQEKFRSLMEDRSEAECNLDFNPWELTPGDLCGVVLTLFCKLDLVEFLGLEPEAFLDFILAVETKYLCNPYHSFHHAVDVCNFLYYSLSELGISYCLSQEDILTLMISGLCHDIGHPGVNNLYQINAKTQIALDFDGVSVLENYSCRLTSELIASFKLFQCPSSKCTTSESTLKKWITENILATDMAFHFSQLADISNILEEWPSTAPRSFCPNDSGIVSGCEEELVAEPLRRKLCKLLLHAADISNAVRPWTLCKSWSDLVVSEFFHQGDLERVNNLPISPNMDRINANQPQIALDFEELIVRPYFEFLADFIPTCCVFLENLSENRKEWLELMSLVPSAARRDSVDGALTKAKRVSFASGTVLVPARFREDARHFSSDFSNGFGRRTFSRTASLLRNSDKRKGFLPGQVKGFGKLLDDKHIVTAESLASALELLSIESPTVS
ncbi:hypothetical protein DSO57_1035866 [Entomophthora muscae]|uniref:Uncharacterized protein n=1 Tax=Entomophthora muscae TaxID=34485 RepID=A0ACC2SC39_9FUNG|nr:hypothetical protein DSO57_1035866 [Entomophthora muscae]